MLRKKLKLGSIESNSSTLTSSGDNHCGLENINTSIIKNISAQPLTSPYFKKPIWKKFYDLELSLNEEIQDIQLETRITNVYNPIEYSKEIHCAYLRKFLDGEKKVLLVGMNPGPNGMGQTGVPFGNIKTVRNYMKLEGSVYQPSQVHPKRPITGLSCQIEEPSGVRIWNLILEIAGDVNTFGKQCFMHNFCPLAFFDENGRNITPQELKGKSKTQIRDICNKYLDTEIQLVKPEIIVGIGSYVWDCLKRLQKLEYYKGTQIKFLLLPHPSPRSLNNTNWPAKAREFFTSNDLLKYIQNDL